MSCYSVRPNTNIFTVYTGLTASGYDLAQPDQGELIHNVIRRIMDYRWPQRVLDYFRMARTDTCEVNPYWPRAFLLAFSSLHLSGPPSYEYTNPGEIIQRILEQDINPADKQPDTISWLMELPEVYAIIQSQPVFSKIWELFPNALDTDQCEQEVHRALSSIVHHIAVDADQFPEIIVVPNPLQSPEVTDFVAVDGVLYVIGSHPDSSSIIHEVLHHIFESTLRSCRELIDLSFYLFAPVRDEMIRLQYAWADDLPSWYRVFEENLVRATVIWIMHQDDLCAAMEAADYQHSFGFIYVPIITKYLTENEAVLRNLTSFIGECLRECDRYNSQ